MIFDGFLPRIHWMIGEKKPGLEVIKPDDE